MLSVFALVFACKLTYSLSLALALAKGLFLILPFGFYIYKLNTIGTSSGLKQL